MFTAPSTSPPIALAQTKLVLWSEVVASGVSPHLELEHLLQAEPCRGSFWHWAALLGMFKLRIATPRLGPGQLHLLAGAKHPGMEGSSAPPTALWTLWGGPS